MFSPSQILGRSRANPGDLARRMGKPPRAHQVLLALATATGLLALAGCGQKGPLYLPAPPAQGAADAPATGTPDADSRR